MKLENALRGVQRLGLDSVAVIYFADEVPAYSPVLRAIFKRIQDGRITAATSVVTLTETLVLCLRDADQAKAQTYRTLLLNSENIQVLPVAVAIAEEAARLRADYNLKTPDALQIATALAAGCEAFLTNDDALRRVGEVRVLVLKELVS